jgi:hypothetical protein
MSYGGVADHSELTATLNRPSHPIELTASRTFQVYPDFIRLELLFSAHDASQEKLGKTLSELSAKVSAEQLSRVFATNVKLYVRRSEPSIRIDETSRNGGVLSFRGHYSLVIDSEIFMPVWQPPVDNLLALLGGLKFQLVDYSYLYIGLIKGVFSDAAKAAAVAARKQAERIADVNDCELVYPPYSVRQSSDSFEPPEVTSVTEKSMRARATAYSSQPTSESSGHSPMAGSVVVAAPTVRDVTATIAVTYETAKKSTKSKE